MKITLLIGILSFSSFTYADGGQEGNKGSADRDGSRHTTNYGQRRIGGADGNRSVDGHEIGDKGVSKLVNESNNDHRTNNGGMGNGGP